MSDWVKWLESPILGGMLNWSHAAFTKLTGNCIHLSLLFLLLRCHEVCGGDSGVTENITNISRKTISSGFIYNEIFVVSKFATLK